ncbi:THUMP-like domain-containing protein [Sphingobacterium sp. LRF_L2]|uniref:class I SAM-dependent methyltransferase n=1 Tax=Sphingobacterium sp. LRF_L2 TaxID=3369421 RepID=UPI003F5DC641
MNKEVLSAEIQSFILKNQDRNPLTIALQKSPFTGVSSKELAQQIDGRQRLTKKVPDWLNTDFIYFPEKLSLEQCSSTDTGRFKASLVKKGVRLIDLTGGFGVDSYYFAKQANHIVHCEISTELSDIVAHNFREMGLHHVDCHAGDGISFLKENTSGFDYIYIDPSRRVQTQKVFRLEDCIPNVVDHQDLFFSSAPVVITKLAPLMDIASALNSLSFVKDVYVLSVENDCKELLIVQEKGYTAVPCIYAVQLSPKETKIFSFNYEEERSTISSFSLEVGNYLYDPDVAITKAGAFKIVGKRFELQKLHQHSHLYTNNVPLYAFPGRLFSVYATYSLAQFKKEIKIKKANVVAKNFPLKVEELRKKFKIKDGSDDYLYFTKLENDNLVVIHARRLFANQ